MQILDELRERGWSVAIHNDYRINREPRTFLLLTHSNGRWVKGEATTDEGAIRQCRDQIERYSFEGAPNAGTMSTDGAVVTLGFKDAHQALAFTRWLSRAVA